MRSSIALCLVAATLAASQSTTSAATTTTTSAGPCQPVYNSCIQSYINAGGSPNFADCNAKSAACAGTVSVRPTSTSTAVPTSKAPTSSMGGAPGSTTMRPWMPVYTGAAPSQAPFVGGVLAFAGLAALL